MNRRWMKRFSLADRPVSRAAAMASVLSISAVAFLSLPACRTAAPSASASVDSEAATPIPAAASTAATAANTTSDATGVSASALQPIDWRHDIPADQMRKSADGEWTSPVVEPPFAFDELIYSWGVRLNDGEAFRIYLKAAFAAGDDTGWLYGGFWGELKEPVTDRKKPVFDRGQVDMDWLKLKAKAATIQFKIVDAGKTVLAGPPALHVVATDNHPTPELARGFSPTYPDGAPAARVFDIPLRRQVDSKGERMKDRCQSAALASAMEYFGKSVHLEDIVAHTHDPEYNYPGLWPRVIGAAGEFGYDGYVDRFRDWNRVRAALAEHKIILCSIRMAEGDCKAPPYPSMGNHIVALCGVTDDGRAIVTDSGLGKDGRGYLCQWLLEDFEKVWMKTKGGVAMVICPPKGFRVKTVSTLAPFPTDRTLPPGDNH